MSRAAESCPRDAACPSQKSAGERGKISRQSPRDVLIPAGGGRALQEEGRRMQVPARFPHAPPPTQLCPPSPHGYSCDTPSPLSPLLSPPPHARAQLRHPPLPPFATQVQVHAQRGLQRLRQQAQVPLSLWLRRHLGEQPSSKTSCFVATRLRAAPPHPAQSRTHPSPSPPRPSADAPPTPKRKEPPCHAVMRLALPPSGWPATGTQGFSEPRVLRTAVHAGRALRGGGYG